MTPCWANGAFAATRRVPVLAAATLLAGIAVGLLSVLWLSLLTNRSTVIEQPHVFGVTSALEQAGSAIGALGCGFVLAHLGITATLIAAAVATACSTAITPPLPGRPRPQPIRSST